jgi:hypothetical protein
MNDDGHFRLTDPQGNIIAKIPAPYWSRPVFPSSFLARSKASSLWLSQQIGALEQLLRPFPATNGHRAPSRARLLTMKGCLR